MILHTSPLTTLLWKVGEILPTPPVLETISWFSTLYPSFLTCSPSLPLPLSLTLSLTLSLFTSKFYKDDILGEFQWIVNRMVLSKGSKKRGKNVVIIKILFFYGNGGRVQRWIPHIFSIIKSSNSFSLMRPEMDEFDHGFTGKPIQ